MKQIPVLALMLAILFSCTSNKKLLDGTNLKEVKNSPLNLKVYKMILKNGLKILVYEDHRLPIFSYYQFYNVGGRFEKKGTTGATHFLEHMMFKGSKNFKAGSFDRIIEAAGGSNNAYTTFDNTVYYDIAPISILDPIIKLEADRMANLVIEENSFQKERNVVFSERKMRYENSPRGLLYLAAMKTIYKGTPYGGSVIGDVKDLKNLNSKDLFKFYKQFYTPDNSIIIIAGDVKHDDIFKKIKQSFGNFSKSSNETQEYKEKMNNPKRYEFSKSIPRNVNYYSTNKNPLFMLVYKGDKIGVKRTYLLDLLSMMAGSGESSFLFKKLVLKKNALFSRISVQNYNQVNSGIFYFSGELMPKVSLKRAKRLLLKEIGNLCKKGITDRSVQKTKNQILIDYYSSIQSNKGIAHFLGREEYYFGDYNYYKTELSIYNSITTREVKDVCLNFLKTKEYSFITVWNKNSKKLE